MAFAGSPLSGAPRILAAMASTLDPGDRVRRLERDLRARPNDAALHDQLVNALKRVVARPDREVILSKICRDLPHAFTSQLHLAKVAEERGDRQAAILGYLRALQTAQNRGLWKNERSTPPALVPLVLHAMDLAHNARSELFQRCLEPLVARYGRDELGRVIKGLAMYLGAIPTTYADPRQRPSFFYVPDLPVTPVFPREALPFAEWFEAQTDAILGDLERVLETVPAPAPSATGKKVDARGIQAFHYDVPEAKRGTLVKGTWDAYFFYVEGVKLETQHAACPEVSRVLAELPLDHVREHGPEVCFSIMRPGAHILPHRGVSNSRSVLHLGLDIPDGCALNLVGVQELTWKRGRCWAFDDTYLHEAWNRSDRRRVVLLGDIWNPHLRPAEREALATLIGVIGDFNRATVLPG
jgi:aspartate beta-hydroxylase